MSKSKKRRVGICAGCKRTGPLRAKDACGACYMRKRRLTHPSKRPMGWLTKEEAVAIQELRVLEAEALRLKRARMEALFREGLPVVVICARLGVSESLVKLHARERGLRLPTFPEWDEVNVA